MVDLNSVVVNGENWNLLSATGINDSGVIVGYGYVTLSVGVRVHGFMLTPMEERGGVPISGLSASQLNPLSVPPQEGSLFLVGDPGLSEGPTIAPPSQLRGDNLVSPTSLAEPRLTPAGVLNPTLFQDSYFAVLGSPTLGSDLLASPIEFPAG